MSQTAPGRVLRVRFRQPLSTVPRHLEAICVAATQVATGRAVVFVERATRELPPWANQDAIRLYQRAGFAVHRSFGAYVWEDRR